MTVDIVLLQQILDTVHSVKKKRGGSITPSLVSRLPNNLHAKLQNCKISKLRKKSLHILDLCFAKHLLLSIFFFCRKLMNCPQEGLYVAFSFHSEDFNVVSEVYARFKTFTAVYRRGTNEHVPLCPA